MAGWRMDDVKTKVHVLNLVSNSSEMTAIKSQGEKFQPPEFEIHILKK